jgi:hypothetical protein
MLTHLESSFFHTPVVQTIMSTGSNLTLTDVLEMNEHSLANLVIEKFLQHTPCKIRFSVKPRQSSGDSQLTMDDQTGVLFGCNYTGKKTNPFEFGIYFKDPLQFEKDGESISLVDPLHRQHKVFSGSSFVGTCYYNWDEFKTNCTMYKKDTYNCTEVQLIPGNESSWQRTTDIFPFASRLWKTKASIHRFLTGCSHLPVKNDSLCELLSTADCNPRHFSPIRGRSSIKGRGLDEIVPTRHCPPSQHKRSRSAMIIQTQKGRRIVCPGCQRFIKNTPEDNGYEIDDSHQTQDCCGIQVCKVQQIYYLLLL